MSKPFDVVIAGAGLAGGSLALRLARAGLNVALVDSSQFPRDKVCGEFLSPECWEALDDLGLTGAIDALGYHPIHRVRISTPRGREVVAEVVGPDGRPGLGLSRYALDDLLVREARAAGATILEGHRVIGPIVAEGRVAGVEVRTPTHENLAIRAAVTVAADGRQSTLVKLTGTTRGRSWFRPRLFGLKRHFQLDDPDHGEEPGTVGLHLIAGGYGGTCRVEGGSTNLCSLLPESTVRARRGDLDRVAAECLGTNPVLARLLAGPHEATAWKTIAGVQVQTSRPALPGILYAGDGQGTVDPLGGQGMTMALLGTADLAPLVKAAVGSGLGVGRDLQERWERTWTRRFRRRITLCRAFHHFLIRPGLTDAVSLVGPLGPRALALGFGLTRESRWVRRAGGVAPAPGIHLERMTSPLRSPETTHYPEGPGVRSERPSARPASAGGTGRGLSLSTPLPMDGQP